jgi:hypothetical protein
LARVGGRKRGARTGLEAVGAVWAQGEDRRWCPSVMYIGLTFNVSRGFAFFGASLPESRVAPLQRKGQDMKMPRRRSPGGRTAVQIRQTELDLIGSERKRTRSRRPARSRHTRARTHPKYPKVSGPK